VENSPLLLTLHSPEQSSNHADTEVIGVLLTVLDPDTADLSELVLTWTLDGIAMPEGPEYVEASGAAAFDLLAPEVGSHRITATVTDPLGASANISVDFQVLMLDADGDGHVNEVFGGTDCDDEDPAIHPDAEEICDGLDNDCDSFVDESGSAVAVLDFNHDGCDDLLIGAPKAETENAAGINVTNGGKVYGVLGATGLASASAALPASRRIMLGSIPQHPAR
jgi:hypothetical protein